ncbi:pentapeptide repeat-containing protein [Microcoleus vaginatus]|uniref:pentapeptide repeat-containing protein n=1 Tax=Microcoleus vaginatus TaxID=119532 RepID=UPI0016838E53|nr:pentapeptide repeat-containing protein [Microcoleus sp. FACHB-84]MBD2009126.1 pentapeptide repeat-containing protein [Microcoleus sp. FACHB-45]
MVKVNQSFSRWRFIGQSFKNKDLTGEDFSYADLRGINFSGATLKGANFSYAQAGQQTKWIIGLLVGLLVAIALAGFIAGFIGLGIGGLIFHQGDLENLLFGIPTFIIFTGLFGVILWRGLGVVLIASVMTVILIATLVMIGGNANVAVLALFLTFLIAVAIVNSVVGAIALVSVWIIARKLAIPLTSITVVISAFTIINLFIGETTQTVSPHFHLLFYTVIFTLTIILIFLSIYISWKVLCGDSKYFFIRQLALIIASLGGTSFRGADLTDANFNQAILKNTDFRKATLIRVYWFQARQLDQARVEGTYLEIPQVRALLVLNNGKDKSFDDLNLRSLNLRGAELANASFIGADLSETTLENANLSGAKLAQSRLYRTNLSGACLTGSVIQDWAISTDTKFDRVRCEFIYMRLPTEDDLDPWRKPDNREEVFKEGDFYDFITPIIKTLALYNQQNVDLRRMATTFKTLDLFHHEKIDPSAAAIALKQLAEQYPEAGIEVVALEGRGEEKIRLQARVTRETDRSKLSAEYIEKYQEIASLPYGDLQSLLAAMVEKDERIRSLENMVMTAMKSDKFYVETYYAFGDSSDANQTVKKILILTANPQNIDKRRLDAEVREIQTGLERAKKRDQFEIISKWAVRPDDLRRALLDYEPQIVHFSGYGSATEGLALENELGQLQMVSTAALAKLFEVFKDKVECVLLNACYSETQAEGIRQHIDYVICMHQAIGNRASIEFAVGFYDALGAGRSIDDAFKLGCIAIDLEGIPESLTPVLKKKNV